VTSFPASLRRSVPRLVAVLAAGAVAAAACGSTPPESTDHAVASIEAPAPAEDGAAGIEASAPAEDGAAGIEAPAPAEDGAAAEPSEPTQPDSTAPVSTGDLPAISVIDVATSQTVQLTEIADGERPTLLWMWAPH